MRANGSFTVANPGATRQTQNDGSVLGSEVPAEPTLSWPPYGATGLPTQLDLTWLATANASSYHVQVGKDSTFTTRLIDDSSVTNTARTVGPLEASTVYFWRVKAKNAGGASAFSSTWKFKTTLATPTLTTPANGAGGLGTSTTLSWLAVTEASWYRVQLARDLCSPCWNRT